MRPRESRAKAACQPVSARHSRGRARDSLGRAAPPPPNPAVPASLPQWRKAPPTVRVSTVEASIEFRGRAPNCMADSMTNSTVGSMVVGAIAQEMSSCNSGTQSGNRRSSLLTAETVRQAVKVPFRLVGGIQRAGETSLLGRLRTKNRHPSTGSNSLLRHPSPILAPCSSRRPSR